MKFLKKWFKTEIEEKDWEIERIGEILKESETALEAFALMQRKIEKNMEARGDFKRT